MVQFREVWPFDVETIQRDMERLLDHVASVRPGPIQFSRGAWQPSIDLYETQDALNVTVELAGIQPEDVNIVVGQDTLFIQGERKRHLKTPSSGIYHVMEVAYGYFERTIPLPAPVDTDEAKASWTNGLLKVTLPKARGGRRGTFHVPIS